METQPTEERWTWTMALIDATLALRFKDEELRDAIDRARGNGAKRMAWHALALRLQKEQGISVPDAKLRRVISKWQSQHRAWAQALATKNAGELALMDRPPTYMPILQRYFKEDSKEVLAASMPEESTVAVAMSSPTTISDDDDNEPVACAEVLPKKTSMGEPPKRPQRPAIVYDLPEAKQRKLTPQKSVEGVAEAPMAMVTSLPVTPTATKGARTGSGANEIHTVTCVSEVLREGTRLSEGREAVTRESIKSGAVQELLMRATQRLSDAQRNHLELQKTHFEEQLALQRKQSDEQFAVQHRQIEAIHAILAALRGSVSV